MDFKPCEIESSKTKTKLLRLRIKGSSLQVDAQCKKDGRKWVGFCMAYKHKIPEDREAYLIDFRNQKTEGKNLIFSAVIDLDSFPFRSANWSLYLAYEEDGKLYGCKMTRDKGRQRKFKDFLFDDCHTRGDYVIFPYYTKSGNVNIRYREKNRYDGNDRKFKEIVARAVYAVRRGHYDRKNIYLVHEKRCNKAQDNGYYLFMHAMENDTEKKMGASIYYVIEKDAPDYNKIRQYDKNVIDFMSIKYMIYLLACKALISSESRNHAYVWQTRESIIAPCIEKKKHVFLQHGILALKQLGSQFFAKNMKSQLVTVSSKREADIVRDYLGYDESAIVDTGYARFDALEDVSSNYKEILLMPTFRPWVFGVERDVFVKSDYYDRYMEFINAPRLSQLLVENGITLNLYQHPSISEHTDAFHSDCPNVRIVYNGEVPLDELMMRCSLLITDYSSIVWDVLYMGKPTVFYQYDRERYDDVWGSYIDLETELPGENATDCDTLIDLVASYIDSGFKMNEAYEPMRKVYYSHLDRDNCKRIWEEIIRKN